MDNRDPNSIDNGSQTPEEQELEKKRTAYNSLEDDLSQREMELATLVAELRSFEILYLKIVGVRLAELDEINAQIAEALSRQVPTDARVQQEAGEARSQARESRRATDSAKEEPESKTRFEPSDDLKSLYREVAKRIHPDLTTDEEERSRREELMKQANQAYQEGNEDKLRSILDEWESSPESIAGEGVGAELVRIIRKISQVESRIAAIMTEITQYAESQLFTLKEKVETAEADGHHLLEQMAEELDRQIIGSKERLAQILNLERE